jgi:hypothetical protein
MVVTPVKKKKVSLGNAVNTAKSIINPIGTLKKSYNALNPAAPTPPPATVASPDFASYTEQAKNTQPAFVPKTKREVKFNPDGSVSYTSGGVSFPNLSKAEYQALQNEQGGGASGIKAKEQADYSENVRRILDTEAAQDAIYRENPNPEGITSEGAMNIYNKIKYEQQAGKLEDIQAIAEREAGKPVEPLDKSGSPQQQAGFVASGLLGAGTAAGAIGAGALGATAAAAVASPVLLGAGAAIITAKSLMAAQGKNRKQDILNAKAYSIDAQRYLNLYKTQALNPNANVDDLISDYYEMKRLVYASAAMIEERSLFDTTFRVNEGADELAKIKVWLANEDNLDRQFFNNLANANNDVYNAMLPGAMASFNQETQQ